MNRIFFFLVSSLEKKNALEVILYVCTFKSSLFLTSALQLGVLLVIYHQAVLHISSKLLRHHW